MSRSGARRRRTTAVAFGVVAALALAGCADDGDEPGRASRPGGDGSSMGPSATADGRTPEITVLDTGAEPRRLLELDVEEGHVEQSVMRVTTSTSADVMSAPPVEVPMEMPLTTRVTDVAGDRITIESTYGTVTIPRGRGLDAAARAQILQSVRMLDGTTIRLVHDRSARTVSSEVEYGDQAGSEVVQRLLDDFAAQSGNLSVLFPEEEVGVGARWTADTTLTVGGITSDLTTTYVLTRLTDDGYTVGVTSRQVPRPGTVMGGEVIGGSTTARGSTTGRRGLVMPELGSSRGRGTVTMEVGGQRVRTSFAVTMEVSTR